MKKSKPTELATIKILADPFTISSDQNYKLSSYGQKAT